MTFLSSHYLLNDMSSMVGMIYYVMYFQSCDGVLSSVTILPKLVKVVKLANEFDL